MQKWDDILISISKLLPLNSFLSIYKLSKFLHNGTLGMDACRLSEAKLM